MKLTILSTQQILKRNILLTWVLFFNLAAQPIPQGDHYYKGQGEIPNFSGFGNPGPGFLQSQINPNSEPSLNPQLTDEINEPHPFPNYLRQFGAEGSFPTIYQQLLKNEPVDNVQSQVFDKAALRGVRKIFVQEFENKTYAPNRDETAGHQLTSHMYKELRNTNKFSVIASPVDEDGNYRFKMSADFSKAKPENLKKTAPGDNPLLEEKDIGILDNDVDAVMIGAVTKFLDHYTDNQGNRRKAFSSGVEFGSYLVNAKSGKVIWGARFVVSQDQAFSGFLHSWQSKSELARTGMKKVLKAFRKTQLQ